MQRLTIIIPFILLFNTFYLFGEEYVVAPLIEAEYMMYDNIIIEENVITFEENTTIFENNSTTDEANGTTLYPMNKMSYEEALKRAKEENKLLMFSIRSTDCKYCERMERETLSDGTVLNALSENFITLHYNQDEDELPLGLQSNMTPSFVFVNQNEDIVDISLGRRDISEFLELLNSVLMESL